MSLFTLRSGVTNHPEASFLQHVSDWVQKGGVITPSSDFLIGERGAGGLYVTISTGHAFVKGTSTSAYPVRNSASIDQAITSNSSGNPRIDAVVLYIDLAATPGATDQATDIAKIMVVAGTPAASPTAPADATIQTAVGAGNPFLRLANVTVASGASGISAGNISQTTVPIIAYSHAPYYPLTYAASITPDLTNGRQQKVTLTGNVTLNEPTNMEIGDVLIIDFIQDATGGRTLTFNFTSIKEVGGAIYLSGVANEIDTIGVRKVGADAYYAYVVGGNMS